MKRIRHRFIQRKRAQGGFTLIEILLVLMIIGIVTAVVAPGFARSIRGNRLRTAARSVVMAGRYARSMAVLEQKAMDVSFDIDAATVSVGDKLKTKLEGVRVEYVEMKNEEIFMNGVCLVTYRSNGRCVPYKIKILDERGAWVVIEVDALSSAKTDGGQ